MTRMITFFERAIALCLFLFLSSFFCNSLLAQSRNVLISRPKARFPERIGVTVGIGVNLTDFNKLNKRLEELKIGKVDNYLAARSLGIYLGDDDLAFSIDVSLGTAFENKLVKPDSTSLNLGSFALGMSVYRSLLHKNRFNLIGSVGFRYADLWLEYNPNTRATTDFNALFSGPAGSGSVVRLQNIGNICLPIGGRLQYSLGKPNSQKAMEYKLGIDAGYTFTAVSKDWRGTGNIGAIQDIPEARPSNTYIYLTFSAFLKR